MVNLQRKPTGKMSIPEGLFDSSSQTREREQRGCLGGDAGVAPEAPVAKQGERENHGEGNMLQVPHWMAFNLQLIPSGF